MLDLITGNEAIAWGARLAQVDYVPIYPITPQTEIVEKLSEWAANGLIRARITKMESEHSMITAAGAAALAGARTFTATSSQGLLYAFEMLYNVSGWRAPFVLANVSRGLAAPLTLLPDHNDALAARDSGFLQFYAETCQEALDSVLIAYRVSESRKVMLPSMVNIDGFYLSFTREKVMIPDELGDFLPPYPIPAISAGNMPSMGPTVLDPSVYSYFKYQMHLAQISTLDELKKAISDYEKVFGIKRSLIDEYMAEDADYVIVMTSSFATMARKAIKSIREKGIKVGLIRPWVLRPFPRDDLLSALAGKRGVAVFDQDVSPGFGGALYAEIASSLYGAPDAPHIGSFIGGLGGKEPTTEEFEFMIRELVSPDLTRRGPVMLWTDKDQRILDEQRSIALRGGVIGRRSLHKDHP
ncbi:transketolase C-terminal domain-containing protein [Tardisphaera saccharovorans]